MKCKCGREIPDSRDCPKYKALTWWSQVVLIVILLMGVIVIAFYLSYQHKHQYKDYKAASTTIRLKQADVKPVHSQVECADLNSVKFKSSREKGYYDNALAMYALYCQMGR